jgi:hypothetical protein
MTEVPDYDARTMSDNIGAAGARGKLEQVARAIAEIYDGYADPVETPNNWARAISAARAAIESMLEPTRAMEDAGIFAHGAVVPSCDCEVIVNPRRIWAAMCDEALKP